VVDAARAKRRVTELVFFGRLEVRRHAGSNPGQAIKNDGVLENPNESAALETQAV
jgi:hypothetical protein